MGQFWIRVSRRDAVGDKADIAKTIENFWFSMIFQGAQGGGAAVGPTRLDGGAGLRKSQHFKENVSKHAVKQSIWKACKRGPG